MSIQRDLGVALQLLLPHQLLSRIVYYAMRWTFRPWKRLVIAALTRAYQIDLADALNEDPESYPSFEAATGAPAELLALTQSLGVMYVKVPNGPGPLDYTIDHSASLLIIDPQGRLAGLIRPPHRVDAIVADLITLMDEGN